VLDQLYRELILDHYRRPRGSAAIPSPDRRAEGQNPLCGDECSVALRLAGERVEEVEFRGRGCSISVASGSMMAQEAKGRTVAEVRRLHRAVVRLLQGGKPEGGVDLGDLEALEGVAQFPVRVKCGLLAWSTLLEALDAPGGDAAARVTTETAGEAPPGPRSPAGGSR
jgi:nitrogen fixation NifU-like protein